MNSNQRKSSQAISNSLNLLNEIKQQLNQQQLVSQQKIGSPEKPKLTQLKLSSKRLIESPRMQQENEQQQQQQFSQQNLQPIGNSSQEIQELQQNSKMLLQHIEEIERETDKMTDSMLTELKSTKTGFEQSCTNVQSQLDSLMQKLSTSLDKQQSSKQMDDYRMTTLLQPSSHFENINKQFMQLMEDINLKNDVMPSINSKEKPIQENYLSLSDFQEIQENELTNQSNIYGDQFYYENQ